MNETEHVLTKYFKILLFDEMNDDIAMIKNVYDALKKWNYDDPPMIRELNESELIGICKHENVAISKECINFILQQAHEATTYCDEYKTGII